MTWHAIEKAVNWRSIEKAEAALQRRHDAFLTWSRVALASATEEILREMRAAPRPNGTAPRLNFGEDYEDWRTGEPMLDGMHHPGL